MKITRNRMAEAIRVLEAADGLTVSGLVKYFNCEEKRVRSRLGLYGYTIPADGQKVSGTETYEKLSTGEAEELPTESVDVLEAHKVIGNGIIDRDIYFQVEALLQAGMTPYLVGLTGTGKTITADWLAKKENLPRLIVNCDVGKLRDLVGRYELVNVGGATTTIFKEGLLTKFLQSESVVFLDEVNSLEGEYLFFLHEILNNRKFFLPEKDKVVYLHPGCRLILAGNPTGPAYYGTKPLNVALLSRCVVCDIPLFAPKELRKLVKDKKIQKFYYEINRLAAEQKLSLGFGIREMLQYEKILALGHGPQKAIEWAFLNKAKMNLEDDEAKTTRDLAKMVLGYEEEAPIVIEATEKEVEG